MFRRLMEWWHARQRGEVRIAPYPLRGRVFDKPEGKGALSVKAAKARPRGTVSARVYRAETGQWEDHGVISKPEE